MPFALKWDETDKPVLFFAQHRLASSIHLIELIINSLSPSLFFGQWKACKILDPWPVTEPGSLAVRGPSPNHWTTREFLTMSSFDTVQMIVKLLSHVWIFVTPWTVACQTPPSMGFSREEYWSGLPFPSPGDLPDSRIKLRSPALQANSLLSEPPGKPTQTMQMIVILQTKSHK